MSDWFFTEESANHGQNRVAELSPNQQKALAALLSNTSIEAAARSCGLGERTIRRYLKEESFSEAYRQARDEAFNEAATALRAIATKAITVFDTGMEEGEDLDTKLRAARSAYDFFLKTVELERKIKETEELEGRIRALEKAQEEGQEAALGRHAW